MVEFNVNLPSTTPPPPVRQHAKLSSLISPIRTDIFLHGDLATQYLTFEQMKFESMKHFLSLDTLLTYFSGEFEVSDLNSQKLMEFVQRLSNGEINTNVKQLGSITNYQINTIIKNSYLDQVFDTHKLFELLTLMITELRTRLEDDEVLKLLHAKTGSEEALESFLDNEMAIKGFLAKEASLYKEGLEDVMEVYLDRIHNIFSVHAAPPLTIGNRWHLLPQTCDVSNLVHTNIVEVILYSEIINNRLPKGIIKVMLLPNTKVQKYKKVQLTLKLFHLEKNIKTFHLSYNLSTGVVSIKGDNLNDDNESEYLKFRLKQGKIRRITGTFRKNAVLVNISEKQNNVDYEKLVLGAWHSNRVIHSHEKEDGDLEQEISHQHKHLEIKYHVYDGSKNYYLVQKKIKIGDDTIGITYTYKNHIPIPLGGTGYIYIKERIIIKAPPIFIPPMQSIPKI
ncbi:hypothetical protein DID80_00980 [Candidatus Marinamargulisbacteria bacterium SCGC AAA071-K20]|nr:hypothetical protein DID80_00980 [Candidatus Marinamargulisbacteria bacterium SCGC AAA071-K20]